MTIHISKRNHNKLIYAIKITCDCAKPETAATLIFQIHLFLFQQAFKQGQLFT